MTPNSMNLWNKIVDCFNKHINSEEKVIQKNWEEIFNNFGYSKFLGTLEAKKYIPIGNKRSLIPDIILKQNDAEICAVELKQETIPLDKDIEDQLFSYLKQGKLKTGVIICDKIYIYAYQYDKNDSEQSKISIDFEINNKDGELFVELFNSETFDHKKISKFVEEIINHNNNIKNIRDNLSKDIVVEALSNYFENKYSKEEVEEALDSIEITIQDNKNEKIKQAIKKPIETTIKQLKFSFDSQILSKGGKPASIYLNKYFVSQSYIDDSFKFNIAKLNKDGKRFWANPPIEVLQYDWCLVLNNTSKKELFIFKIPANSISLERVNTRIHKGKKLIDLEIIHQDGEFVDLVSKIQYKQWFVEKMNY